MILIGGHNNREPNYLYDIAGRLTDYQTTEGSVNDGYDNVDRTNKFLLLLQILLFQILSLEVKLYFRF